LYNCGRIESRPRRISFAGLIKKQEKTHSAMIQSTNKSFDKEARKGIDPGRNKVRAVWPGSFLLPKIYNQHIAYIGGSNLHTPKTKCSINRYRLGHESRYHYKQTKSARHVPTPTTGDLHVLWGEVIVTSTQTSRDRNCCSGPVSIFV
jgi:hypothetical protein